MVILVIFHNLLKNGHIVTGSGTSAVNQPANSGLPLTLICEAYYKMNFLLISPFLAEFWHRISKLTLLLSLKAIIS